MGYNDRIREREVAAIASLHEGDEPFVRPGETLSVPNGSLSKLSKPEPAEKVRDQMKKESVGDFYVGPASLADYNDPDGRKYATRTSPDSLNWGGPLSWNELQKRKLVANRVTIPGDWDYDGDFGQTN